ncbi:efflux RND transporter periplasmic adaptor subunit [Robiginitalea sp. M366]|uniref:efflux RND transporter periplasmic adaptor subunit n=1 Tax=Robiginitalea aestuariiviva TaxID=3036903 RepID=UPI00240D8399|nr:efflux RND transporter periplasmic adaptor subunit [Robiginitalea aestuariiviva]MDG1571265.1 efflux RND transporter periplasmic adaptor subunit [Robiginitalea aestuariiviva]
MKSISTFYMPALMGLALVLQACKGSGDSGAESAAAAADGLIHVSKAQFETNQMELGQPTLRAFPEVLLVSGMVDVPPENRAAISAVRGGFVRDISLLVGDRVSRGQRLVTLESPEFLQLQQEYLENVEQLPYLEAEYKRQKTLFEEQISSEKLFLQAESQYRTALARANSLGKQLDLLHISRKATEAGELTSNSPVYAPIEGHITKVMVRKGSYVSPASEIMEIVNREHLHLELLVFEKDVDQVKIGQRIQFNLPERSENLYDAEVHLIGTSLDENRTVKVHAHLMDEDQDSFLVGMFVKARIELGEADGKPLLALPESAVVASGGKHYLLVMENASEDGYGFRQVAVSVETTAQGYTALKPGSGLDENSQVLTQGAFNLVSPE